MQLNFESLTERKIYIKTQSISTENYCGHACTSHDVVELKQMSMNTFIRIFTCISYGAQLKVEKNLLRGIEQILWLSWLHGVHHKNNTSIM